MNVILGKYNQLEVVKEVDFGVYLDGGDDGEILLPTRYVPEGCKPGDMLNVFKTETNVALAYQRLWKP